MDSTPVPPRNLALPRAVWHNTREFLHRRMPIVRKGRRDSLFRLSGALVMVVALLVFSGCAAAQAAVSPAPTVGEGSSTFVATLTPEGTNPYGIGTAHLQLYPEQQTVCFVILVTHIKLPATATHIHTGAAGVTGPIVVYLRPPNAAGVSAGCMHAPRNLIVAIMQHPVDYYVNVLNKPYPEGAVRGQFFLCTPYVAC
jgi:hypothetical protein